MVLMNFQAGSCILMVLMVLGILIVLIVLMIFVSCAVHGPFQIFDSYVVFRI